MNEEIITNTVESETEVDVSALIGLANGHVYDSTKAREMKIKRSNSKPRDNTSKINKDVREQILEPVYSGVMKCVARPRVFGVRNSGGSNLAKSTLRLGLDTKMVDQVKFEKGLTLNKEEAKHRITEINMSTKQAMEMFEDFEKRLGGCATQSFREKQASYIAKKHTALDELGISVNSKGQPIWSDQTQSQKYFDALKDLSFSYWEVYLSFKPDNVRATQTKKLKVSNLYELRDLLDTVLTKNWDF